MSADSSERGLEGLVCRALTGAALRGSSSTREP